MRRTLSDRRHVGNPILRREEVEGNHAYSKVFVLIGEQSRLDIKRSFVQLFLHRPDTLVCIIILC